MRLLAGIIFLATLALPAGATEIERPKVRLTGNAQQVAAIKPPAITSPAIKPFPIYYPPAEFDRPYTKTLTITTAKDTAEVQKACGKVSAALGCSLRWEDRCTIVLAPESTINAYGWTEEHVLRHELAHCNGWHVDHRGWSLTDPWKGR